MTLYELKEKAKKRVDWRMFVQRIAKSRKRLDGS